MFKMSDTKLCIICNEGSTPSSKKLISSSEMIADLVTVDDDYCNEWLSLGNLEIKPLCDRLNSLSESEKSPVYYLLLVVLCESVEDPQLLVTPLGQKEQNSPQSSILHVLIL